MSRQGVRLNGSGPVRPWSLAAALLTAACGASDADASGPTLPPDAIPVAGCEPYGYGACDVLETACQNQVMGLVSCLRESDPGDLPPVRLLTVSEYRSALEAAHAEGEPADPRYEQALVWLDLAAPGGLSADAQIDDRIELVGAYYSVETRDISIIVPEAGDESADPELATALLAHETVHALQDRELDLIVWEAEGGSGYDPWLARRSTAEGEATLYETLILAALWSLDLGTIELDSRFAARSAATLQAVVEDDTPFMQSLYWFPYSYGARHVAAAYAAGGAQAVHAVLHDPPNATLPLVYPGSAPQPSETWPDVPTGPVGEEAALTDSLGAWLLHVLVLRISDVASDATLASSWRGDRLLVYGTAQAPAALWHVRLATPEDAARLAFLLELGVDAPSWVVRQTGTDVLCFLATDEGSAEDWADTVAP